MASPVIELREVTKTYRMGEVEVHALRGASVSVQQGEMVAIMGPSGSGKSTMMNIIGCLDQPTSGEYLLEGREVSRLSDDQLAEIRNNSICGVGRSDAAYTERAFGRPATAGGNRQSACQQSCDNLG